ncbi:MAG: MarR family transcriptional regulator [Saprospiraceae bacterium]|nr:MarR family transcriptional regulator [Saprospiraceae bacterium]
MKIPEMEESVLPWIGKTAKMMAIFIGDRLKQKGMDLSLQQMIILKILNEEDGRPQQDLAIVTERHKASLTRLLSTLEKKQLVTRVPDQIDKRINRVYLTLQGKQQLQSTYPVMQEVMVEMQEGLDKTALQITIQTLQKIQSNLTI